jgi:adenylate cyclase class 2
MDYVEREAKFYIQNLAGLTERVRMTGAELVQPRLLETNLRLDTPEGDLRKAGRILRIRRDDKVRLTYKDNAHNEDGVVSRTEIEFIADSFDVARKFFEALGYPVSVIYEKYRRVYRIGDVEVMLDELPFGDFVEIEAPNNTLIEGVSQMLGLDLSKMVETNYLGLFERARRNMRFEFRDLTFENFAGLSPTTADLEVQPADG